VFTDSTVDTLVSTEVLVAKVPAKVSNESTEELIEESTVLIAVTTASNESTDA